ncbi:hypothetical protein JHK82_028600 [Glycine max]|uniref:Uncharacterized protein n=2 Tax=Glycine subgen. Soja TaxID=1462606 RepID=A0A0R0I2U0_SOYBN|nr:hypothetical protein JHK87_028509 [Glycine soja]KAG4997828.1 hypothetical protein JHK85_029267 [Glycine max]KAG5004583.1 hypothetical protein JHK86_028722 [Glycine max]KAG5127765.1 hypothetical protein JHK82_028600 [Glycine max]KAG5152378.1 hypothetical protein JHK84_028850 [Glycine max]
MIIVITYYKLFWIHFFYLGLFNELYTVDKYASLNKRTSFLYNFVSNIPLSKNTFPVLCFSPIIGPV